MAGLLETLFGIDRIDLSDTGRIEIALLSAWPAWAIFLALLATAAYVIWIYRRENPDTPPVARGVLMFIRIVLIVMALCMIFEPALVLRQNERIPSAVAVLVDKSVSMSISDPADTGEAQSMADEMLKRSAVQPAEPGHPTRFELARAALAADGGDMLRRLAGEQRVYIYSVDEEPTRIGKIDEPEQVPQALADLAAIAPDGKRTQLARSMQMVLDQLTGQTLTGMVLVTDGRNTVSEDISRLREMAAERDVRLYVVGLGSTEPPPDVEVRRVDAGRRAFVNEELPVRVEIANSGYVGRQATLELEVEGHPSMSRTHEVTFGPEGEPQWVELRLDPEQAGTYRLVARIEPDTGEFDEANNASLPVEVEVLDRKLRVLIVEDLPRWEYQYLKNALVRDPSVLVSVLLYNADLRFPPEGNLPIRQFPTSRDELMDYDVVIVGDVDRRMFSAEQIDWLDDFVRTKGGGLIAIAGSRGFMPESYAETPLETLLPVEPAEDQPVGPFDVAFQPEMTIEGSMSRILRFDNDAAANRDVWRNLPGLFWYYRCRAAKPGAQVLLVHPVDENPYATDGRYPLMALQRVGAGQVFFSAVDSTWRWRWYTGRAYFNDFWLQLVRHMALSQERAVLEPESFRYTLGETAKVQFRVADKQAVPADQTSIKATVRHQGEADVPVEQTIELRRSNPGLAVFEGEVGPETTGRYTVEADIQTTAGETLAAEGMFMVTSSREEFRRPTRDQQYLDLLAALSDANRAIEPSALADVADTVPNKSIEVSNDLTDEVWDSPLFLLLFVGLITTEWILRKRHRML